MRLYGPGLTAGNGCGIVQTAVSPPSRTASRVLKQVNFPSRRETCREHFRRMIFHQSRESKPAGTSLGALIVLGGAVALTLYLRQRHKNSQDAAGNEVTKAVLINHPSVDEVVHFAGDPDNLPHILAQAQEYRGESDGSFVVQFSGPHGLSDDVHGQVETLLPDRVTYSFQKLSSTEPLGRVELQFKPGSRGITVTGRLTAGSLTPLPSALEKLVEKGWLAFTLRQLKMLLETGEVATTHGQASGREK